MSTDVDWYLRLKVMSRQLTIKRSQSTQDSYSLRLVSASPGSLAESTQFW